MAVISSPFDLPLGRLLALDLGQARHGVAVCDPTGILATPLAVLRRHDTRTEDFVELQAVVVREQAGGVLVGLPLQESGEPGGQGRWVLRYAGRMAGSLSVPVAFWDESLSTYDAAVLVRSRTRGPIDAAAAALFLQDFLEARRLYQQARRP
jgi:putative holliday junction resolvase